MLVEELIRVNFGDGVDWDVRSFVLETTVNVKRRVEAPDGVSEPLDCLELVPLGGLSVVDFEGDVFTDLVGSSTDDEHQRSQEECRVLVSWGWLLTGLVWSVYPIPPSVTMSAEPPCVAEG